MLCFFIAIVAYVLGSVPMGLIFTKFMGKGDLRKVGSGNIGATNVMRVGGLRMAGVVWILDMLKAMLAIWLGIWVAGVKVSRWQGNIFFVWNIIGN